MRARVARMRGGASVGESARASPLRSRESRRKSRRPGSGGSRADTARPRRGRRGLTPPSTSRPPPCSAPRPKIAQSRQRRPGAIQPFIRNHRNGSRNAAPISRPISRCVHSHQKMVLNSCERHAAVEMPELRNGLVLVELGLPRGLAQRRQGAGHGLPFDDRQAGLGQPRRAADQHHREDERRHGVKPQPDRALAPFDEVHDHLAGDGADHIQRGRSVKLQGHNAHPHAQARSEPSRCSCWSRSGRCSRWRSRNLRCARRAALSCSLFYVVAGLGWVLPAMPLISWMSRPNPP